MAPWKPVPTLVWAVFLGFIGYNLTWLFLMHTIVAPNQKHEAHIVGQLLVNFELGTFYYLAFISPGLVNFGWAAVLILAYYRKRVICVSLLAFMMIFSIYMTGRVSGHSITLEEIMKGLHYFFNGTSDSFIFTVPFFGTLLLVGILLFRPIRPR